MTETRRVTGRLLLVRGLGDPSTGDVRFEMLNDLPRYRRLYRTNYWYWLPGDHPRFEEFDRFLRIAAADDRTITFTCDAEKRVVDLDYAPDPH
jgi:hypothetical protein